MTFNFFKNNFKCNDHWECDDRASCAVDVLLELYYYAIFQKTRNNHMLSISSGLIGKLNAACKERTIKGLAACRTRRPVWEWLVDNLPEAYVPMGRPDAEILEALSWIRNMTDLPAFKIRRMDSVCNSCGYMFQTEENSLLAPLPITFCITREVHGFIPDALSAVMLQQRCSQCRCKISCSQLIMPEFLMLEIGIVNFKNQQDPPILIPEHMSLSKGIQYELVGAVMVKPDHFCCIVKHDSTFVILDDLKDSPTKYQCFSGAVCNDFQLLQDHHFTSRNDDGIHVLIYASKSCNSTQNCCLTVQEEGQQTYSYHCERFEVGSSARNIMQTSDSHEMLSPLGIIPRREKRHSNDIERELIIHNSKTGAAERESAEIKSVQNIIPSDPSAGTVKTESPEPIMQGINVQNSKRTNKTLHNEQAVQSILRVSTKGVSEFRNGRSDVLAKKTTNLNGKIQGQQLNGSSKASATTVSGQNAVSVTEIATSSVVLLGRKVPCKTRSGILYLECKEFFDLSGLQKNVTKEGYRFIDKKITNSGIQVSNAFILRGQRIRQYMSIEAIKCVLKNFGRIE